jgi:TctA family transporter
MIATWWAGYLFGVIVGFTLGYHWEKFSALVNWIANRLRHPRKGI